MIVSLIYIFIALFAILKYTKCEYKQFVILTSLLVFKGFGFIPLILGFIGSPNVYNFLLIEILGIIIIQYVKHKNILTTKYDSIGKVILWILLYQFVIVIFSGLTGVDTWINVFGQYRFCFLPLIYFIMRPIGGNVYIKLYPMGLKVARALVFFYIIFSLCVGSNVQNPFKDSIFGLAAVMLFVLLFENQKILFRRKIQIVILSLGIFMLMARIYFLAIISAIAFFVVVVNRRKKLIFPLLLLLVMAPFIMFLLDSIKSKSQESNSLSTEISIIRSSSDYSDYSTSSGALRFTMVMERFDYMIKHPVNLMFGIGAMKEITAQEKISFISGTNGTLEEDGKVVTLKLDTDDVGLLSMFMRYGLCYVFLFVLWHIRIFRQYRSLLNYPFMKTGYLLTMVMLLSIPGSNLYFYEWSSYIYLCLMGLSTNYKQI